jgi:hypothetical protein
MAPNHTWPCQSSSPELGVGPEMFDWNAAGLVVSFLLSILVLALAILLARWIATLWGRTSPPRHN